CVVRFTPFHWTVDDGEKPEPSTLRVNAAFPADVPTGEIVEIAGTEGPLLPPPPPPPPQLEIARPRVTRSAAATYFKSRKANMTFLPRRNVRTRVGGWRFDSIIALGLNFRCVY